MKKLFVLFAVAGMIFSFSCGKSGGKSEQLTDPQIDATIGVVRDHVQYVRAYAISPDGKTIVTAGDYDYIFWNAANASEIKAFRTEKYDKSLFRYSSVKFTPDGKLVIIAGYYGLKIIDAAQMKELKTLTFDRFNGEDFDISKDGSYLALADGQTLKVVDLNTYEVVKTFGESENDYRELAFINDTQFATLEYNSEDMYIWDVEQGKDVDVISVTAKSKLLATDAGGEYLAVYDDDAEKTLVINTETSQEKMIETGYLNDMTFMDDNLVLINNSKIKFFNLESGEQTKSFDKSGVSIQYDEVNSMLYYINDGVVALNPENGNVIKRFGNDAQGISGVLPSPSGKFIVLETDHKTGIGGPNLFCLPVDTSAKVNLFGTSTSTYGVAAFVGNTDNIADVVTNGDIEVYDLATGKKTKEFSDIANEPLVFTPDGKKLIARDYNNSNTYCLFNFENMQKVNDLTNTSSYIQYAGITPDGKYYVLSTNEKVFVYDVEAGQEVTVNHELEDTRLVDKIDDKYVAVRCDISKLSVVNLLDGSLVVSFEDVYASRVAISPDKKFIAIAPRDNFGVFLYDLAADDWRPVLYGHTNFPTNVAFTQDSKYLISVSNDNQAIIWDVASGKRVLTIVVYDLSDGTTGATTDYIVYAPNGRYDGTPAAIDRFLYFEKDGKRLPASQYKDKCYTPNLLGKTLGQNFVTE